MCVFSEAEAYLMKGASRIGGSYKKVRYVEYTDNNFLTKMLRRAPEEVHLGILGNVSPTHHNPVCASPFTEPRMTAALSRQKPKTELMFRKLHYVRALGASNVASCHRNNKQSTETQCRSACICQHHYVFSLEWIGLVLLHLDATGIKGPMKGNQYDDLWKGYVLSILAAWLYLK